MKSDNLHRLLRRQIKVHFGTIENIPTNLAAFISSINNAYKDYDIDLFNKDLILELNSNELTTANNEFKKKNIIKELTIKEKTTDLKKIAQNLQNAERVAELGSFIFDLKTKKMELSEQIVRLCKLRNIDVNSNFYQFLDNFENEKEVKKVVLNAKKNRIKFKIENVRLKNDLSYYLLEGDFYEDIDNESIVLIGILQDTTISKLREIELSTTLELLENYKNAVEQSAIISRTDEHGIISYVNDKFCKISGYSKQELIGKNHNIVNSNYHPKEFFADFWQTITKGKVWQGNVKNKAKNGDFYWVDTTIVPFFKKGKIFSYISIRYDITEKINNLQKTQEQKDFYEDILKNIPVDIAVFDKNHKYLFINPIAVKNALTREYLIGKDDFEYCKKFNKDISIAQNRRKFFLQVTKTTKIKEFVDKTIGPAGKTHYTLRRFSPTFNNVNELKYMIGFGIDITEKTEQAIKLQQSLEEKDALLGEVHHRVKNNLAMVLGLVEMQSFSTKNIDLKIEFAEIRNRISAMSLIHEKLYKSANFAKIDLKDYLLELISSIRTFFNREKNVALNFEVEEIYATSKKAIPIALIVTEAITNAFKYAFNEKKKGVLTILLKKTDDEIVLIIADNGPGISEEINLSESKTLGFKLVHIFTKQIKGTYDIKNNDGLILTIRFKNDE